MGCTGSKSGNGKCAGTLYYFPLHGRGGAIRMMLTHANVTFTDEMIAPADWPKHKPNMPGGTMPVWQPEGSTMKFGQRNAIMHMLGRKYGYLGKDAKETFRLEHSLECFNDFMAKDVLGSATGDVTDDQQKAYGEALGKYLMDMEEMMKMAGGKYIAGDRITIADFVCFSIVSTSWMNPAANKKFEEACTMVLDKCPCVKAWAMLMQSENKVYIAKRVQSPL